MKSEDYKKLAIQESNKRKAQGLEIKAMREARYENFTGIWLGKFINKCHVEQGKAFSFIIDSAQFGRLIFYPKSNKVLRLESSTWIKPGLKWLVENLLKK
jgi:hypothetical protein